MSDNLKQGTLFEMKNETQTGPVTCLGLTFENDDARRAYFTEELRKKLPELKKIEGYPIGNDEDILALSDPPYYTACPNPWFKDFIYEWNTSDSSNSDENRYHREPFAADVSEGKNDPIYNAHSYHTKVPHKAIMRYILHYTDPGDIVFDGFCGTGMTGVAAQLCGDRNTVMELGYQVKNDGSILREEVDEEGRSIWKTFSKLGVRRAILNDLSPAATFISNNYNMPVDVQSFRDDAQSTFDYVEKKYGWMYETRHSDGQIGAINYIVWSDVFICPECSGEVVFWNAAVDREVGRVKDVFPCPHCDTILGKKQMERAKISKYDAALQETTIQAKQVPVLINYSVSGKRQEKLPDDLDFELIQKIENMEVPYWHPTNELIDGFNTRQPKGSHGITHSHHFYTKSSLFWLSALTDRCKRYDYTFLPTFSIINTITKLYRYVVKKPDYKGQGGGILSGTLYAPSLVRGLSASSSYKRSISRLEKIFSFKSEYSNYAISTGDVSKIEAPDSSLDYIFIDPPFGANLNYSELNFLWESWLKVSTDNKPEAIENSVQQKGLDEYRQLMTNCFKEAYRVLKPGRWMTVEFSNTKASVWNSIQTALTEAGFIVANVSALDKKQGSFKAVTTTTAVKQDLVISAYKPSEEMKNRIESNSNTEESTWAFVRNHLENLPVFIGNKGSADLIVERTPRVLFDRMISYYVQNGFNVPVSSAEFQNGVIQRFPFRDGMVFLEAQVAEYDKKRTLVRDFSQMNLFVTDENSAIEWLRQQLLAKPQTRQDLHSNFMKEIQHISKQELLPELDILLEQNFLQYDGISPVPSQIHTYLSSDYKELRNLTKNDPVLMRKAKERWYVPDPNKQADLERLREKSLLREFETYRDELVGNRKKLKQFRTEAIRAGFKKAWGEKDYQTIVTIGERLPENVLQEDDKLLMYYDNAQIRLGL
ncbi:DNA methyltransferase [Paenibacillus nasutitermitis]|uniref:DNA methylase n=1 Tax=Paenibacillus nasutitermitis TaxID=1652958 RepID=A0A917E4G2_9BACL|nr:DNA methyltransferase [Paenibacillus nasutitermitis]GGD99909.1 DNA methylase [Paenibacillus nasutitermitis]